jgi:hypothetical protein
MIPLFSRRKLARAVICFGLLAALASGSVSIAFGQSFATPDVRLSLETNSRFGICTYVPDNWGELHLRLENPGEAPRDVLCTTYFGEKPALQFGRQVWLPAHSRLSISHPALFPKAAELDHDTAKLRTLLIERSSGAEAALNSGSGQLVDERPVLVPPTTRNTGLIAGWEPDAVVPQDVLDLIVAGRVGQGLSNKVTYLTGHFLSADETDLKYLDHIVIAENRLVDDFAALAAVRRWLHGGGRLWILLDRTDPVLLEHLLGDEFQGHVVDRVGLTSVRVDEAPSPTVPDGKQGESATYEEPVEMARVVVAGMKIRNSVEGWPAAAVLEYGEGRVLITALGARGWIKPAPPDPRKPEQRAPNMQSAFVTTSPMEDLSAYILAPRETETLAATTLEPIVREYVSYRIPAWSFIVGAMSALLLALLGLGIWLWRSERLEHFGWSGSLLALVFGVLLTGLGAVNRHRVPETMASVQLAQALDGADDVRSHGTIGVYRAEGSPSPIGAVHGGKLWPDMTAAAGATCRMVTTDLGTFHWEGLPQPAGLQLYPFATSQSFSDRIEARATLDGHGLVGNYVGPAAAGTDAVLATRYGRMGVQLSPDGAFAVLADDVFDPDQYLDASFLGDAQDRRRRLLQELFDNSNFKDALNRPQILMWVKEWQHGFEFGDLSDRQGETLLMLPLDITRPASGTELVIPAPLLGYATCRPPDGSLPAGCWDDDRGEWQERSGSSTTWLTFQVPRDLLPIEPMKAQLEVKVTGSIGRFDVLGMKQQAIVNLGGRNDPAGMLRFEIDDPEVLAVAANGELILGVSAGGATNAEPAGTGDASGSAAMNPTLAATLHAKYWKIESLSLKLWGKTTAQTEEN